MSKSAKKLQDYKGYRRVVSIFCCASVSMIVISFIATLLCFYWLINNHVDQAVRMSQVKNLQILASTLAQQKMNEIGLRASNTWAFANQLSDFTSNPNTEFIQSLLH